MLIFLNMFVCGPWELNASGNICKIGPWMLVSKTLPNVGTLLATIKTVVVDKTVMNCGNIKLWILLSNSLRLRVHHFIGLFLNINLRGSVHCAWMYFCRNSLFTVSVEDIHTLPIPVKVSSVCHRDAQLEYFRFSFAPAIFAKCQFVVFTKDILQRAPH